MQQTVKAEFPDKLQFLIQPKRYKIAYGGRGGTKSWGFARALLILGAQKPLRILCARETQKSIADSVYKLLCDQIEALQLQYFYTVTKTNIVGRNGTEFTFAGIRQSSVAMPCGHCDQGLKTLLKPYTPRTSRSMHPVLIPPKGRPQQGA